MTPEQIATACAAAASNKKAGDIVVLDLQGLSGFTDLFVVCSADSEPQIKAVVGEIEQRLREEHRLRPAAIDGSTASQWVVLDYLQVLVHVFHKDKRAFYGIEELWSDAPRLDWERKPDAAKPPTVGRDHGP